VSLVLKAVSIMSFGLRPEEYAFEASLLELQLVCNSAWVTWTVAEQAKR